MTARRNLVRVGGESVEKDAKTHQMRRLPINQDTIDVLNEHRRAYDKLCCQLAANSAGLRHNEAAVCAGWAMPVESDAVIGR